ncbi:MAG: hypothetical protein NC308_03280 [Clostridium sp.]|nr:hypothetical protein [Bacteroides sp.]MCM1197888.1 hypothetical protein [Clostridium sp.]
MKFTGIIQARLVLAFGAALTCAASCVYIDDNLGKNFIPSDQIYDIKVASLPLDRETVWLESADSLSCYSSSRITIGSIREESGLSKRSSAFTVVPVLDSIDIGKNTKFRQFHFNFVKDTTSYISESQKNIIQNIKVYELKDRLDSTFMYSSDFSLENIVTDRLVTDGVPVYKGDDSLSFDLSRDYAMKYIELFKKNPGIHNDQVAFLKEIPGIYVETDDPVSNGGRINMFDVAIQVKDYYVTGNYAELKITADYGTRTAVDTSFLFYYGPADRTNTSTTQSAFNICSQPTDALKDGGIMPEFTTVAEDGRNKVFYKNGEEIFIEGGSGLKPVISAKGLRSLVLSQFESDGVNPENVIINKATLVFPFEFPDNYDNMFLFPSVLSPTCKISMSSTAEDGSDGLKYATFAGLTDASVDSENQGDVNRSLCVYSPDISHHVQEIIRLGENYEKFANYDIWLLIMAYETVTSSSSSSSDMDSYYQNLAYANYYNNLMYGGYGGYGYGYGGYGYGYDSYGYGYSNYLNYAMMASMYSNSGNTTSTELQLDKDRYYAGKLYGTEAADEQNRPYIKLIYSILHNK